MCYADFRQGLLLILPRLFLYWSKKNEHFWKVFSSSTLMGEKQFTWLWCVWYLLPKVFCIEPLNHFKIYLKSNNILIMCSSLDDIITCSSEITMPHVCQIRQWQLSAMFDTSYVNYVNLASSPFLNHPILNFNSHFRFLWIALTLR